MRRVAFAFLLLCVWSVAGRFSQGTTTLIYPQIIASIAVTDQTAPTPFIPIVTPVASGMYRISAYIETSGLIHCTNAWQAQIQWTDDVGARAVLNTSQASNSCASSFTAVTVRGAAGMPIAYKVRATGGPTTPYDLYITVEQLM
jgi:hypothetical protein